MRALPICIVAIPLLACSDAPSDSDRLAIRLTTSMPVAEAREYYSNALREIGREEAPSRVVPSAPMAGLHATKDGVTLMATITAMGDSTQVNLNAHDR